MGLDETRTSHVHAKVRGFIESISVDFISKPVRKRQPPVTVYSQDALAGIFIDPSVELYLISDVRKLWVLADDRVEPREIVLGPPRGSSPASGSW